MTQDENELFLDVARGDAGLSRHLKNSLSVLRDKIEDPSFKKVVDEIVSGKRSLREEFSSEIFANALDPYVRQGAEEFERMEADEKEELARTGERQLAELGAEDRAQSKPDSGSDDVDWDDFSEQTWLR